MSFGPATGVVTAFDVGVGLGVITDGHDGRWPFHCSAITDHDRTIDVGTVVRFERTWGGPGRWEAGSVHPMPSAEG